MAWAQPLITLFVPAGGVLLGGYLVRRFDLKRSLRMAARFCVIASIFTVAGSSAWFIPGCGVPDLAGVIAPYSGRWEKDAVKDLTRPPVVFLLLHLARGTGRGGSAEWVGQYSFYTILTERYSFHITFMQWEKEPLSHTYLGTLHLFF